MLTGLIEMGMNTPRKPHFSLFRTFVLADLFTIANAACGMASILLSIRYATTHDRATIVPCFVLPPLALIFDVLDGSIARWSKRHSPLGADLDSLSDIVSFGVAPAALGFTLGLDGFLDAAILVFFVVCGISRLARYNATHDTLAGDDGKVAYYEGTPIPTSLLVVLLVGIAHYRGMVTAWPLVLGAWTLHPLALVYGVSGMAMVSASLRIPKP